MKEKFPTVKEALEAAKAQKESETDFPQLESPQLAQENETEVFEKLEDITVESLKLQDLELNPHDESPTSNKDWGEIVSEIYEEREPDDTSPISKTTQSLKDIAHKMTQEAREEWNSVKQKTQSVIEKMGSFFRRGIDEMNDSARELQSTILPLAMPSENAQTQESPKSVAMGDVDEQSPQKEEQQQDAESDAMFHMKPLRAQAFMRYDPEPIDVPKHKDAAMHIPEYLAIPLSEKFPSKEKNIPVLDAKYASRVRLLPAKKTDEQPKEQPKATQADAGSEVRLQADSSLPRTIIYRSPTAMRKNLDTPTFRYKQNTERLNAAMREQVRTKGFDVQVSGDFSPFRETGIIESMQIDLSSPPYNGPRLPSPPTPHFVTTESERFYQSLLNDDVPEYVDEQDIAENDAAEDAIQEQEWQKYQEQLDESFAAIERMHDAPTADATQAVESAPLPQTSPAQHTARHVAQPIAQAGQGAAPNDTTQAPAPQPQADPAAAALPAQHESAQPASLAPASADMPPQPVPAQAIVPQQPTFAPTQNPAPTSSTSAIPPQAPATQAQSHFAWQQNAQSYLGAWQPQPSSPVPQTRPSTTPFVLPAVSVVAPAHEPAPAIAPQQPTFAPTQNPAPTSSTSAIPPQAPAASASAYPQNLGHIAPAAPTDYVASPLALQNPESRARFMLPPLAFLQSPTSEHFEIDETEIDRKVNNLLGKLRLFKIEGDIVGIHTGPIVTTFEYRPAPHIKVSRILNLSDDLAMALQAKTLRIEAPVPGKDVVGIEIPNSQSETILLRDVLQSEAFVRSLSPLTLALGKDIIGRPFVTDLRRLPHLLIAGTTGSGKSVGINAMILSLLYRNTPRELKFIMIDPKMLEFSVYNDIPHLLTPVITESKKAISALAATVGEMEKRYAAMSALQAKNIETYNQKVGRDAALPYIVVVIDELADLMMTGGKEVEFHIARLAQMARASGIHLIIATQRPSVDVVTGSIKANLPARISYKVGAKVDSKVILDTFGAETLLGKGDMLFNQPDGSGIVRLHAPWSSEDEITRIVEFLKSQGAPEYDEEFLKGSEPSARGSAFEGDDLYEQAKQVILNDRKTSTSYLQRRLGIGYNKAANIIEELEREGFLSAPNSKGAREIL